MSVVHRTVHIDLTPHGLFLLKRTFKRLSGEVITSGCSRLNARSTRLMCSGVCHVLEMSDGRNMMMASCAH